MIGKVIYEEDETSNATSIENEDRMTENTEHVIEEVNQLIEHDYYSDYDDNATDAATKIQATERGRIARKYIKKLKDGSIPLDDSEIKKGLSTLGMNPFTFEFSFIKFTCQNNAIDNIDAIRKYPYLQYIDISDNVINSLEPLNSLPYLTYLNASNNKLVEMFNIVFSDENNIDKVVKENQLIMSTLQDLNLSFNLISNISNLSAHLYLTKLNLSNNQIVEIDGLNELKFLSFLDLSYNQISNVENLSNTSLIHLNLSDNNIQHIDHLNILCYLEYLNLNNNQISDLCDLSNCVNLQILEINSNNISSIYEIHKLKPLENLAYLNLNDNQIVDIEFFRWRVIFQLQQIIELNEINISPQEKIKSINFFASDGSDLENRKNTFFNYFPNESFQNLLPPFAETINEIFS